MYVPYKQVKTVSSRWLTNNLIYSIYTVCVFVSAVPSAAPQNITLEVVLSRVSFTVYTCIPSSLCPRL